MPRPKSKATVQTEDDATHGREMLEVRGTGRGLRVQVTAAGREAVTLDLPSGAILVLKRILTEMGGGSAAPAETEIGMQQAADLMNVSPPYVTGLIEKGALPARMVGGEPCLPLKDVLVYDAEEHAKRLEALAEMNAIDQELGLR